MISVFAIIFHNNAETLIKTSLGGLPILDPLKVQSPKIIIFRIYKNKQMDRDHRDQHIDDLFFLQKLTFHVRLRFDHLEMEKTFNALKKKAPYLIVGKEYSKSGQLHQHILLSADETVCKKCVNTKGKTDVEKVKTFYKDLLRTVYPDIKDNKQWSFVEQRNAKSNKKYCLKDGEFLFKGFTQQSIDEAFKLSYSEAKYKKQFQDIREKLLLQEISLATYAEKYIQYKADSEQSLYMNHVEAHIRTMGVKTGEIDAKVLSDRVMDRIYS